MSEPAFGFMKVRTQSYEELGFRMETGLLGGPDTVVQRRRKEASWNVNDANATSRFLR